MMLVRDRIRAKRYTSVKPVWNLTLRSLVEN